MPSEYRCMSTSDCTDTRMRRVLTVFHSCAQPPSLGHSMSVATCVPILVTDLTHVRSVPSGSPVVTFCRGM